MRTSIDVAATAIASLALHAATINMLVLSGALSQEQADQAYTNALRYLRDAAAEAPENAETLAVTEALILSLVDDCNVTF